LVPGPSIGPDVLAALRSPPGDVADARQLASAFLVTDTQRDVFVMDDLVRPHTRESTKDLTVYPQVRSVQAEGMRVLAVTFSVRLVTGRTGLAG
jgi:hypothetical protein